MSRGQLRSGKAYIKSNSPYCATFEELKKRHSRLFSPFPALTTTAARILGTNRGILSQTTARFLFNSRDIQKTLVHLFQQLFQEHGGEGAGAAFEVVVVRPVFN